MKFVKIRATWYDTVTSFSFLVCFFGLLLGSSLKSFRREIVTPTETGKPTSFFGISPQRIQIVLGKVMHHNFLASSGRLRVRFYKKIQDWILKSERIRKWILRFFTRRINPRSLGSWCVKGTEVSSLEVDSSVPLTHNDHFLGTTAAFFSPGVGLCRGISAYDNIMEFKIYDATAATTPQILHIL